MACQKGIMLTLLRIGESRESIQLAQLIKASLSAGKDLWV